MPAHEVIDLSLSSDYEKSSKKARPESKCQGKDSGYLDYDYILDTPRPAHLTSKRRKLVATDSAIPSNGKDESCDVAEGRGALHDSNEISSRNANSKKDQTVLPPKTSADLYPMFFSSSPPPLPRPQKIITGTTKEKLPESKLPNDPLDLDPRFFSSSPHPLAKPAAASRQAFCTVSTFSDPLSEVSLFESSPEPQSTSLSAATTALLAEITNNSKPSRKGPPDQRRKPDGLTNGFDKIEDVEDALPAIKSKKTARRAREGSERPQKDGTSKEEKSRLREAEKEQKKIARETAAQQKIIEKEQKAKEKRIAADLAEANKARWDKKISTSEMIVDLPASIDGTSVDTKVREMLRELQVEVTTNCSLLRNVVKWRRKSRAAFNEELGHWELRPLTVLNEQQVACLVSAQDFVTAVAAEKTTTTDTEGGGGDSIEKQISQIKAKYADSKIVYLIEGLESWQRKRKNALNREYQAAVRGGAAATNNTNARRKGGGQSSGINNVDDATLEDALLKLQVAHECLVYHTENSTESAEWIVHFTQHISTIPYKTLRSSKANEASFCMEVGQVKTGEDAQDTYIKMLQQIVRVTAPIAYGIAAEHPDVASLMDCFRKKGGNLALEDLKKCTNKDGSLSDARIGPQMSRRIANVFMGEDPLSMNI